MTLLAPTAFTRGKTLRSGINVEQTKQIVNVRIHVNGLLETSEKSIHFSVPHSLLSLYRQQMRLQQHLYVLLVCLLICVTQ